MSHAKRMLEEQMVEEHIQEMIDLEVLDEDDEDDAHIIALILKAHQGIDLTKEEQRLLDEASDRMEEAQSMADLRRKMEKDD